MMNVNCIKFLFSLMAFSVTACGSLIYNIEKYVPVFIVRTFRYGKFAYKGPYNSLLKPIEVPKSWFRHFYIFSSILCSIALWLVFGSYVFNVPVPSWLKHVLDAITGKHFQSKVTPSAALLSLLLLTIQCFRRLHDTHFVSVFGSRSLMNLSHYMVGYIHYLGAVLAILVEAPNFSLSSNKIYYFRWSDLSQKDYAATILFLWACLHQFKATVILANLRKTETGKVVSHGHYMPEGDWFKYVSSPHLFAEIIMYFSLTVILWENTTWTYIFAWVLSNQVEVALLAHRWYKETFPKYPKRRRAVIPFIL